MHNSLPEYRVAFWRRLSELCDLDLCITHPELESKDYGFNFEHGGLSVIAGDGSNIDPAGYDVVVLPPSDSVKDLRIADRVIGLCGQAGIPTVFWSEAWMPQSGSWSVKRAVKRMLKRAASQRVATRVSCCVVPGTLAEGYLRDLGADDICRVVDAAEVGEIVPQKAQEVRASLPEGKKILLYFGRLKKFKGTAALADAFREICQRRDDIFMLVCGDGECREELAATLREGCPEGSWRMEGKVDPRWRASYYSVANAFVLPSCMHDGQIEIWGLSVNESLEAGVPVIATDAVGAAYDMVDESVGAVVPQGDSSALAVAIEDVLARNECGAMAGACRARAAQYSTENMAQGFYRVFCDLAGKDGYHA